MAEDDLRCLCCGLRVADSEWCMETRDGDHRPTLPPSARGACSHGPAVVCDPSTIEFVMLGDGTVRPFDPALDLSS